jgi:hypothetical protein
MIFYGKGREENIELEYKKIEKRGKICVGGGSREN